jgi:hypothetical protein
LTYTFNVSRSKFNAEYRLIITRNEVALNRHFKSNEKEF